VLKDALRDVHSFSRTRALPALRTSDKRIFLETRATLYRLAKVTPPATREIRQAVENLARFLDSMSVVSRARTCDCTTVPSSPGPAATWRRRSSTSGCRRLPGASWRTPSRRRLALYGRDVQLDAYLRGQRHFPADWLHDQELALEMARLGEVLAESPLPDQKRPSRTRRKAPFSEATTAEATSPADSLPSSK